MLHIPVHIPLPKMQNRNQLNSRAKVFLSSSVDGTYILLHYLFLELKVGVRKCLQISGYIYGFSQNMIIVLFTIIANVLNLQKMGEKTNMKTCHKCMT